MEGRPMNRLLIALLLPMAAGCMPRISGLLPVEPSPVGGKVTTLQPTLQWEALPVRDDPHVSDVVYDLEIYTERGDLFYLRNDLGAAEHRLEAVLAAMERYRWRVRARFRWDGKRRETQWNAVVGGMSISPLGMPLVAP
jgi:hypothetical protein